MAGKLEKKVAIVTGASSGIGEATALALAAEGAKVVIAARRGELLNTLAKGIEASGGSCLPIICDLTDETQAQNVVQKANADFGRVDILVNNAGVALFGNIDGADTSDWRRMIDINLLGVLYITHAALPIFKSQREGHIVNISSVAGRTARAGIGAYNLTKWGINGFSEALRQEVYEDKIRVTIIEPGMVDTEIDSHITDAIARERSTQKRQSIVPLQSSDIAAAIVYALSQPQHVNVNEILIRPTEQGW